MDMKTPKLNNRAFSMIIAIALAMLSLNPTQLKANGTNPEKNQTEAKLITKIGQWLDGKPVAFEKRTEAAMTQKMHNMSKRMKAYEAQLQAEIDRLEQLEGFQTVKVIASKKKSVKPIVLKPVKTNPEVEKPAQEVPSLMAYRN